MKELWLDTSMLRRWNLRLDTAEADKFFKFCEEWGLRILLPEVVLSELVQHYVSEATAKLQAVDRSIRDVAALEIPVAEGPVARPPADLTSHYRKLLERRCAEKSITIIPPQAKSPPRRSSICPLDGFPLSRATKVSAAFTTPS